MHQGLKEKLLQPHNFHEPTFECDSFPLRPQHKTRFSFRLRLALQAVAEASSHLPTYEAQQLQACIKGLREDLLRLRAQCEPKKRFSFARKAALAQAEPGSLPNCRQDVDRSNAETGMVQSSDMVQNQARGQERQVVPESNLHTGTNGSSAATPHDTGPALSGRCCTHSSTSSH